MKRVPGDQGDVNVLWLHVLRVNVQLEKQMTVLENRVDKAIQRLCGRQAETGRLRDGIDGLRKERLSLNEALAKLEAALAAQRAEAARLLRISQADCMSRDKVSSAANTTSAACASTSVDSCIFVRDLCSVLAMRLRAIADISWHQMTLLLRLQSSVLQPY